jgi:hypothetical protein
VITGQLVCGEVKQSVEFTVVRIASNWRLLDARWIE